MSPKHEAKNAPVKNAEKKSPQQLITVEESDEDADTSKEADAKTTKTNAAVMQQVMRETAGPVLKPNELSKEDAV